MSHREFGKCVYVNASMCMHLCAHIYTRARVGPVQNSYGFPKDPKILKIHRFIKCAKFKARTPQNKTQKVTIKTQITKHHKHHEIHKIARITNQNPKISIFMSGNSRDSNSSKAKIQKQAKS